MTVGAAWTDALRSSLLCPQVFTSQGIPSQTPGWQITIKGDASSSAPLFQTGLQTQLLPETSAGRVTTLSDAWDTLASLL